MRKMDGQQKYNIQDNIGALLKKNCELEKFIHFLKYIGRFEEIDGIIEKRR